MPARRITAVSPDGAFGRELAAALGAVAGVTVDLSGDGAAPAAPAARGAPGADPDPALCVIHLAGGLADAPGEPLARLAGTCPVIAVLPRPDLAAALRVFQASDRVACVIAADGDAPHLEPRRLAAMAARLVDDDVLGLARIMAPGTQIHACEVRDFRDKTRCMAQLAELAEAAAVPRRLREPIEQCADEMLMNALYDAPVDARGRHVFAGVPTRTRILWRTQHRVLVEYACDGRQLAIAVRDAAGSLARRTVLDHLHKGLHAAQKVDRKAGGAGLGLYLMANAATGVHFHVLPGIATEAICTFDLQAPAPRLAELGFLVQRDPAGRRRSPPARRIRAVPRRVLRAAAAAVAVAAAAVVVAAVALPRGPGAGAPLAGADAAAPDPRTLATVELESEPTGAEVEIDGRPAGSTPLTLTSLPPGATVAAVFRRTGYRPATARLAVPGPGERLRHVQPLEASDELVAVRFVSRPPGAEVRRTGEPPSIDRTYTPAEVFVEAGQVHRFTLLMPGRVPLVIEPFTPRRGEGGLEKGGDLVPGAILRIEATLDGKISVAGAPHCRELALPAACTLAPGRHVVEYVGPTTAPIARAVTMTAADATERLELGIVEAAAGKRLEPGGLPRAVFPAGTHTITVSDTAGARRKTVTVGAGATIVVD
jgi:hypothetical protein